MKSLWNIFSFLAVAHLLAIVMFVGWLWQSNRLDVDRINAARELFAMTIPEASQAAEARREADEEQAEAAMAEQRRLHPPLPSEVRVRQISRLEEIENRTLRQIEQEKAALRDQMAAAQARLDQREAQLEAERSQWLATVEDERTRRTDEQFAKAVRQLESIRPRQAKDMLMELLADSEMQQAVAYLDAMKARAASRILGEFKSEEEITLATELLEQLRMFAVPDIETQTAQDDSTDASNLADAQ